MFAFTLTTLNSTESIVTLFTTLNWLYLHSSNCLCYQMTTYITDRSYNLLQNGNIKAKTI